MFKRETAEKVTRLSNPKHDQVNGLLDKGCSFEGKLTFDGTVQINGDYKGEIFSDGVLIIGTEARVQAKIFVDTLIVYGKLDGKIESKTRVEMHVPAVVTADVNTRNLAIEDGVIFQGTCRMDRHAETTTEVDSSSSTPNVASVVLEDAVEEDDNVEDDNVFVL